MSDGRNLWASEGVLGMHVGLRIRVVRVCRRVAQRGCSWVGVCARHGIDVIIRVGLTAGLLAALASPLHTAGHTKFGVAVSLKFRSTPAFRR